VPVDEIGEFAANLDATVVGKLLDLAYYETMDRAFLG
jgi:hypothetical protein